MSLRDKLLTLATAVVVSMSMNTPQASAQCEPAGSQGCRNMDEAKRAYEQQQREKQQEKMRDTTPEGRIPLGRDTSIGGSVEKDGGSINVRTKTP